MLMIIILIAYIYFSYMSRYRYSYRMSSVETGKFIYVNFSRLRYLVDKDWAMSQGYQALKQSFLTHLERVADKQRKGSHHMIVHLLSVCGYRKPCQRTNKAGRVFCCQPRPVRRFASCAYVRKCQLLWGLSPSVSVLEIFKKGSQHLRKGREKFHIKKFNTKPKGLNNKKSGWNC